MYICFCVRYLVRQAQILIACETNSQALKSCLHCLHQCAATESFTAVSVSKTLCVPFIMFTSRNTPYHFQFQSLGQDLECSLQPKNSVRPVSLIQCAVHFFSKNLQSLKVSVQVCCKHFHICLKYPLLFFSLMNEVVLTSPTIGSNVEEVVWKNIHFLMWDIGGQESLRASWNTYYTNSEVCRNKKR